MAYIGPNFNIVTDEELKIGLLKDDGLGNISGYQEIELLKGENTTKNITLEKNYRKRLPLCKAGDNKYWVLTSEGKIEKLYIK